MAQENLNTSTPNSGLGDFLRSAFVKVQNMFTELYSGKVDKEVGKGLSANDFTGVLKNKLDNIAGFAEVNVQADFNQADNTQDNFIKNKPVIPVFGDLLLNGGFIGTANDLAPKASPTFTGTVSGITKSMVGLGNVDNTTDLNKPVSTAQLTALNLKANLASPSFSGPVNVGTIFSSDSFNTRSTSSAGGFGLFNILNASGIARFVIGNVGLETGSNIGNNFAIYRYGDDGGLLGANPAFQITRSSGLATFQDGIIATTGTFSAGLIGTTLNGLTVGRGGGGLVSNIGIGQFPLNSNTTGTNNIAIGGSALISNNGSNSTAIGSTALNAITTGSSNVGIGVNAGSLTSPAGANSTGSSSVFLGNETRALANNETNQIVIGNGAIGAGSNTVTLGNTSITSTVLRGTVTTTSARFTENIGIGGAARVFGGAFNQIQLGNGAGNTSTVFGQNNVPALGFISNGFYNASNQRIYANSAFSVSELFLYDGELIFRNAGMGTAGNEITTTQRFIIAANGNATFSGTVTATSFPTSSDIRLKDLVTPYDYTQVANLNPITFQYKNGSDDLKHYGYSAQDVQEVMPYAVIENENGFLSVNYTEVLVAKVKYLEDKLSALELRLQALEAS